MSAMGPEALASSLLHRSPSRAESVERLVASEPDREESALTFMVYLNDDFDGGDTAFWDDGIVIRPRAGSALFFFHAILHEGREVTRGVKYVLRTDVMYRYDG